MIYRVQVILTACAGAAVAVVFMQRNRAWLGRPRIPSRRRLAHQVGGFAGPWASPGLGVDDCDDGSSGFSCSAVGIVRRA